MGSPSTTESFLHLRERESRVGHHRGGPERGVAEENAITKDGCEFLMDRVPSQ